MLAIGLAAAVGACGDGPPPIPDPSEMAELVYRVEDAGESVEAIATRWIRDLCAFSELSKMFPPELVKIMMVSN